MQFRLWYTYSLAILDGKSRGTCLIPVQVTLILVWPNRTQVQLPGWTSCKQHKPKVKNQPTNMTWLRITTSPTGWATRVFPICWEKAWRHWLNYVHVQASSFVHMKFYYNKMPLYLKSNTQSFSSSESPLHFVTWSAKRKQQLPVSANHGHPVTHA